MSLIAKLDVIDPQERDTVYDLDSAREVVTIGQDPTDDVILANPHSAPFHLELSYGQQPYCLTIPEQPQGVTINREFVPPGASYDIRDRDVIRVAGYTITFRVYEDAPGPSVVVPPPPLPPTPVSPPPEEESPPAARPEEESGDDVGPPIVTSLPEQEQAWVIDVEQSVTLPLTVVNAGTLVAEFQVAVEGVPPDWVDVDPPEFHLNERAGRTVIITVTPPRLPTSRAGTYHLALVATSPDNYPGERSEAGLDLAIKPYYEIAVSNPSPKRQSIPWSQPSRQVEIPISNKGNSIASVGLAGEDDAHAARFEFLVPDETDDPLRLTRQVSLRLPFDTTLRVPVGIIPSNRPLIGEGGRLFDLRPGVHPYTITVTPVESRQGPWTLIGEWENKPRFSRRVLSVFIFAIMLVLLACTCVVFTPGIASPDQPRPAWVFAPRVPAPDYAQPASIRAGQVVELNWRAWPPFLVSFELDGRRVSPPIYDRPDRTTTYKLRADTWLSHLLPFWSETAVDTVVVRPVDPDILLFEAQPARVAPGQTFVLSWVVDDAAELVLVDHAAGVQETLDTPYGSREIQAGSDSTHYTLRATGADRDVIERVAVVDVGSPVIRVFSVEPAAITDPTVVTLTWSVFGARDGDLALSYQSIKETETQPAALPIRLVGSRGTIVQPVTGTTLFSLTAGSGAAQVVETVRVKVLKSTPAPAVPRTFTEAPVPGPANAAAEKPGTLIVYTALSDAELARFDFGVPLDRPLAGIADSLIEAGLTVKELDDLAIYTPPNALSTNIVIVRKSTEDLIRQLLAEKDDPRADVIWGVAATGMIRLRAEGLLEPLAGVYEPDGLDKIKAGWSDPTLPPRWVGLGAWLTTFCVDPDNLLDDSGNPLPVPRSWADLANPGYEGRIVMPGPYASGTGVMVVSSLIQMSPFGEPDGWAYMDQLHENVAHYTRSGDEPCRLVADGQIGVGIGANICTPDSRYQNRVLVYPKEGAGWEMDAVALVRKDTISDSALDFVTWAISQQAMERYGQFRPVLSLEGFEPSQPCVEGFGEIEISTDRLLWTSANLKRITEEWQSRYGSESE